MVAGFVLAPNLMRTAERLSRRHLERSVPDPELRARLRPDYRIGCKRILLSSTYYPALAKPNVDVVAGGLSEVRGSTVVAADGTEAEVDAIIFGTGFHVTDPPVAGLVHGRDGKTLADVWSTGLEAHAGTTVAGFPNFFMMTGPNTGLGHSSMIRMIESQLNYILDGLRQMERHGAQTVEARREAQTAYNSELQRRMAKTIWITGGCNSWYLDPRNGKNTSLWPGSTIEFRRRLRHFDPADYVLEPARSHEAVAAVS
jgi:cation diffusion facilitator CzcD-associated flavoprotein CzcO